MGILGPIDTDYIFDNLKKGDAVEDANSIKVTVAVVSIQKIATFFSACIK